MTSQPSRAVRQLAEVLRYVGVASPIVILLDGRGRCIATTVVEDDLAVDLLAVQLAKHEAPNAGAEQVRVEDARGASVTFELCAVRGDVVLAVALPEPCARFALRERRARALPLLRKIVCPTSVGGGFGAPPATDGGSGAPVSPDVARSAARRPS